MITDKQVGFPDEPGRNDSDLPRHADYPHVPGRLHDCPACEARCHCAAGDAECVYDGQHNGLAQA